MNKEDIRREFKFQVKELRKIVNAWDLIPGCPNDEFDALNHKLLSHLQLGEDESKIARVIEGELTTTYGFYSNEFESNQLAKEIMGWWNQRNEF